MKILILGHKGLLGNCVNKFFSDKHSVTTLQYRYPSLSFIEHISLYDGDYIINCIGQIPQKVDKFDVNVSLPILIDQIAKCRIIQPSSDCEQDDSPYGLSKKMASDYLINFGQHTKIIQASIVGLELNSSYSLLSWLLSQHGEINGYTKALWNGITTLEWCKSAENLMTNWDLYGKNTVFGTKCISKYELLNIINNIFNVGLKINPVNNGKDRCLTVDHYIGDIQDKLVELKNFYNV
jgi:dTDP-4-dehydrorhamnose reductase